MWPEFSFFLLWRGIATVKSCTAIFVLAAVLTALYCVASSVCRHYRFYIVSQITSHYVGNSLLVRRIGSRVCSRELEQTGPIHTEFPYRKVVRERLQ